MGRPSKKLRRQALQSFRQSAAWKKIQQNYVKEGLTGKWDQMEGDGPAVQSMRGPTEEVILISSDKSNCGAFDGTLSMLFRVEDNGALREVDASEIFIAGLIASADFDGDGDLDFVGSSDYGNTQLVKRGPGLFIESETQVLVNVCGC